MKEEPGEPAGRANASSCRSASFPTRNKELDISEPDIHEICDTNSERVSRSGERLIKQQEHSENWDQG